MFNRNKPQSGLQQRLGEVRGDLQPVEHKPLDRDTLLSEVRPQAQKEIQKKFTDQDLANRHSGVLRKKVRSIILELIEARAPEFPKPLLLGLAEELMDDLLGYGPLEQFFTGPQADRITEIKVINPKLIRVEIEGKEIIATDDNGVPVSFRDDQHVRDILERMIAPTGRRVDLANPRVSARLPDGSRIMAHIYPVAVDGTTISIRRFRQDMTMEKFLEHETLDQKVADFLSACVKARLNIIVSGGTSSGKSTFLNVLADYIPEEESIITIEDPAELQLQHTNVRRLEARPSNIEGKGEITQRDLVADGLRMAPKRIIVGECRKGEAFDMMQAMNTGHDGSLTTGHSNNAYDLVNSRLPNMIQMAGMGLPFEAILVMIASAVDLVVHICKDRTGRRRVDQICEIIGLRKNEGNQCIATQDIFRYDNDQGIWVRTEHPFTRADRLRWAGVEVK